jgi:hypothetical protein
MEQTVAQYGVLSRQLHAATEINSGTSGDSFSPAKGYNSRALKKKQGRYPLPPPPLTLSAIMILLVGAARQLTALPAHDKHRIFGALSVGRKRLVSVTG